MASVAVFCAEGRAGNNHRTGEWLF